MKKNVRSLCLSLIFLACGTGPSLAQSPRLQLLEYFDNTSIPPFGAVANANVDSLMVNYSNKITCIKYHVAWGSATGTDPMNLHNPGQILTRVQYYNVTADPHAKQDGGVPADSTFSGQPSTFTKAHITRRDSVTSPFTMQVSHSLNTAKDTIFTQTIIKKTGLADSTNPLVAHVVVLEKRVYFATPPGISGDKVFHNVVKWMLPGDTGTVLPAMNIGDSVIYNYSWKLANVYDINQLCVVSFIQHRDSTNREVYQAGQSFPTPLQIDLGVNAPVNYNLICDSTDQLVILKNLGVDTLKTATLTYRLDAGTPVVMPWTGSIASGKTDSVWIHLTGLSSGTHTLKVVSSNPNGVADMHPWSDTANTTFAVAANAVPSPLIEGFQTAFPSASWIISNPSANTLTWGQATVGGFGYSNRSAKLAFYDIVAGQHHHLVPPPLDMSADTGNMYLNFSLAHASFAKPANDPFNYFDTLVISVSTDCGKTWAIVYMKSDTALNTAPANANGFTPSSSQWKHQQVNMTSYVGQSEVQLRFTGRSGYGNNMYIDDINLSHASVGVANLNTLRLVELYPNPSTGRSNLNIELSEASLLTIEVINLVGETVRSINAGTSRGGSYILNLEDQPAGLYFIKVSTPGGSKTQKLILQR